MSKNELNTAEFKGRVISELGWIKQSITDSNATTEKLVTEVKENCQRVCDHNRELHKEVFTRLRKVEKGGPLVSPLRFLKSLFGPFKF